LEKYPKPGYGNLALKTCVEDVLGFAIDKDLSRSNWSTEDQLQWEHQYNRP
jgi:ribonuclease D